MNYTVRQIPPWDHGQLVELAREFHAETGIQSVFSEKAFLDVVVASEPRKTCIGLFQGTKLVGALLGMITGQLMTTAKIAQELMWYVTPEHRGSRAAFGMLNRFQDWAEAEGATDVIVASLGPDTNKVAELYKRLGYKLIETHFIKHLKD